MPAAIVLRLALMSDAVPASRAPRSGVPPIVLVTALLAALVLGACSPAGTPTISGSSLASGPPASAAPSESIAPTESAAPTETPLPTPAPDPPPIGLEEVASEFATPIGLVAAGADRLLVAEQGGRIASIEPDGSVHGVVDLSSRTSADGERGLLGLALHPGWPEVGRAFVHYTDLDGNTVLSELTAASTDPPSLDPATERILLQVEQPAPNHNGGQLAFGPDGYLYMALGDGGGGGDPSGNGQNPTTLLGAILRIDVDDGDPYAIPADNPFASGGGAPEVYVHGLRNPWRFSFDRATGDLWIGDVGQNAWEEIDRLDAGAAAGANLGWNVTEGAHCFADAGCDPAAFVLPVAEYPTADGCAVTGGYVYRGAAVPGLWGWYLFADYCSGLVYAVRSDAPPSADAAAAPRTLLEPGMAIASLGQDASGELYVADAASGTIHRITAGEAGSRPAPGG